MNQTALLAIAVAAGFAGGFVGSVLISPAPAADSAGAAGEADPVLESSVADLQDRMNALEASADALELSVGVLDGRYDQLAARMPDRGPTGPAGDGPGSVPELAAADLPTGAGFDAAVNAVIEQREAAEEAERQAERERRQREALERRVDRIGEQLNLDPGQKQKMVAVLEESNEKRENWFREMRQQAEAGGDRNWDREAMRTQMEQFRAEEMEAMGEFLTPDQLTQYQEIPSGGGRRGGIQFGGDLGGRQRGGNAGGGF